jgi:hypothetical protein
MLFNKGIIADRGADREHMLAGLTALHMPVMISSRVNTEGWERTGRKLTEAFLDFWNSWPPFPPGLIVVACLLVKYVKNFEADNDNARKFLEELKLDSYQNIHGALLPELRAIRRGQVDNWIDDGNNFDQFCDKHQLEFCNPPAAFSYIADIYEQPDLRLDSGGYPVMPMKALAVRLLDLLRTTRCQK